MTDLAVAVFRETGQGQGLFDDRGEVPVGDMGNPGPAHQTGGEDIVLVGFLGLLDAVGGHQDGPGKFGEFLVLVLPGRPVVAVEMGIFFQLRIAVGGQHLAVGIDVDALAFGLLRSFQVLEIMAGDQDGLAFLVPQRDLGGTGWP